MSWRLALSPSARGRAVEANQVLEFYVKLLSVSLRIMTCSAPARMVAGPITSRLLNDRPTRLALHQAAVRCRPVAPRRVPVFPDCSLYKRPSVMLCNPSEWPLVRQTNVNVDSDNERVRRKETMYYAWVGAQLPDRQRVLSCCPAVLITWLRAELAHQWRRAAVVVANQAGINSTT